MGPDLKSKGWIVAKGLLFAFLSLASAILQVVEDHPLKIEIGLLAICVWASCRFYYFLFYVLHAYVDPDLKSAGLLDLAGKVIKRGMPWIMACLTHLNASLLRDVVSLRRLQIILVGGCMVFSMAGIILPLIWMRDIVATIRLSGVPISTSEIFRWIGPALIGPAMLLLCGGVVIYCISHRKRLPWLLPLLSLVAIYGVASGAGPVSHDLSHALFDSCDGFSSFVDSLILVAGISMPSCYFLNMREHGARVCIPVWTTGFFRRSKVVLTVIVSVFLIWLAAAYFMDL